MIKKILLVDDSPISRKILKSCMPKDQEYDFYEAGDGQEGLTKFSEVHPDVTFLDITMPVMNGLECLEEIKKFDERAIIIMCTADVQPKSILKAAALGAIAVLRKPPSKETVQDALTKVQEFLQKTQDT
ncbi:MAG: response regulator [Syntrophus sp. (in: bacteria)]|nr:response regulator [Syntrophus sp. (in: bacteria)]